MKKRVWIPIVVLLAFGGGYVAAAHFSGGAFPTPGIPVGGDRGLLRRSSLSFWEDIQFKDFEAAAEYHAPESQDTVDIPYLLERLFLVKPEFLDIMSYEVVMADIDSTGNRGRVKTRIKCKELVHNSIRDREIMLYFQRVDATAPWYMELESSLRGDDAEDGKKH
jgi:hypothetical protein